MQENFITKTKEDKKNEACLFFEKQGFKIVSIILA